MIRGVIKQPQPTVTLSLESGKKPLTGQLCMAGHADRPFIGWIGLLAALDAVVRALPDSDEASNEAGVTSPLTRPDGST